MSALVYPPRLTLAHTPTPLERYPGLGEPLGYELYIKRDDLTGAALSGNKVRKLEFLLAEAETRGATKVVTCGGVNSNHARATAVAAAQRGMRAHLLLRGEDRRPAVGNLLLDRWVGADVTFVTADEYAHRAERMAELAGPDGYVIPEGGSNGLGALGYAYAVEELLADADRAGVKLGRVVHACGSGGTTAGLALGFATAGLDVAVHAVAVMADATYFDAEVQRVLDETVARGFASAEVVARARWNIVEGFVGEGYAKTRPAALETLHRLARRTGLVLDPVYTGKAWLALADGAIPNGPGATVFIHTGGIFELFAYAEQIADVV